jgi:ATP-dependent DNA helicase DinG
VYNEKLVTSLQLLTSNIESSEERPGQTGMALAVDASIESSEHLVVEAGTGTGKTLAYLFPYALNGKRVVVATYTKALQDQMLKSDLPLLKKHIESEKNRSFNFLLLKGWSNYLCNERVDAAEKSKLNGRQESFFADNDFDEIDKIIEWSKTTKTGDRSDIRFSIKESTWDSMSVTRKECFGKEKCPFYDSCFAFKSREKSSQVDVIVTNHALYALDLAIGGHLVGPHEHVVIDEAHEMETSFTRAWSITLSSGRFDWLAAQSKRILKEENLNEITNITELAELLSKNMTQHEGHWVRSSNAAAILQTLELAEGRVERLNHLVRTTSNEERTKLRITNAADSLLEDIRAVILFLNSGPTLSQVAWIEFNDRGKPELNISPLDVSENLKEYLWEQKQAVLTSATIQTNLIDRLGVPVDDGNPLRIESPFNYVKQSLIYCPDMPDPRKDTANWQDLVLVETEKLISLAGGRTLCLFTSRNEMQRVTREMRTRFDLPIFMQGDRSAKELLREFAADETSCLFGTRTFFQGVDIPGPALSLVILNKIPFPGPTEFLIKAWSEQSSLSTHGFGWRNIELPIGVLRVVQAAGRLIRKKDDLGVVAVLDPRMTRSDYGHKFLDSLPDMPITKNIDDVEVFFAKTPEY